MSDLSNTTQKSNATELATPGARLGSHLLEVILAVVTLGIGWLIWSFFNLGTGNYSWAQGFEAIHREREDR